MSNFKKLPFKGAAEILGYDDRPKEQVEVPEWGCTLYVRKISAGQALRFATAKMDGLETMVKTLICSVCDAEGKPVFADEHAAGLKEKDPEALLRLYRAAERINGLRGEDVEEARGKSRATPSSPSGSASPSDSG